jgi:BASS family bile acid:Na+ symporter
MEHFRHSLEKIALVIHHNVLGVVLLAYVAAAVCPEPGTALRRHVVSRVADLEVTLPMALLALLLFNAGLGTAPADLAKVGRKPRAVIAGWGANLLVPVLILGLLSLALRLWHDASEAEALLTGLAVVAAMPVAGSSAAYAQNADGNGAVSLGLVLSSTLLSPFTTPAVFRALEGMVNGSDTILAVTAGQAEMVLVVCVVGPSLAGLALRAVGGGGWMAAARPVMKLANAASLLILCYANATVALPHIVADPDWDYLGLTVTAVVVVCGAGFGAGWLVARLLNVAEDQRRSLVYGLGMSNNGTGLVLGTSALAGHSEALLPIIVYNLAQHVLAATVHRWHAFHTGRDQDPAGRTPQ